MRQRHPWIPEHADVVIVAAMLSCVFMLQVWHLQTVFLPATDEGVYALIGNLLLRGYSLHTDVPLWHMPLLPVLAGIGKQLLGGMYGLRLAYLTINCLAVLPLYAVLRRVTGSRLAAVMGIALYVTFNEMMNHDFRMLAIRQPANALLIVFLWCDLCGNKMVWRRWAQGVCAVLSALLFLPALLQLAVMAAALVFSTPKNERMESMRAYTVIILLAAASAAGYLAIMHGAFGQVVLEQVHRMSFGYWERVARILRKPDALFMAFGATSLMLSAFVFPKWRWLYVGMWIAVLLSVFQSTNYFDHYIASAGPALALGTAAGVLLFRHVAGAFPMRLREPAVWIACSALLLWHLRMNVPILLLTWMHPGIPGYAQALEVLRQQPEPILTVQPIYLAETEKLPTPSLWQVVFRPPSNGVPSRELYARAYAEACTVLVEQGMRIVVPPDILHTWTGSSVQIYADTQTAIYRTQNTGCTMPN